MANTPNYNLKKVEYTEIADIPGHFNANFDTIDTVMKNNADAVEDVEDELIAHKAENMPHQFINHKENKTYKFGFQVSVDGKPQIIYEEVV